MEVSPHDVMAVTSVEEQQWMLTFVHKDLAEKSIYRPIWHWQDWFIQADKQNVYHKINKIVFDESVKGMRPFWVAGLFQRMTSLKTIVGLEYLDVSHSVNMQETFAGCENLEELNLTSWDTHRVQDMSRMFAGCKKLQRLNLHSFDVSCVKDFKDMFQGCESLQEVLVNARYVDYWPRSWDFLRPSSA